MAPARDHEIIGQAGTRELAQDCWLECYPVVLRLRAFMANSRLSTSMLDTSSGLATSMQSQLDLPDSVFVLEVKNTFFQLKEVGEFPKAHERAHYAPPGRLSTPRALK